MLKLFKRDFWYCLLLVALPVFFFLDLFYPTLKIFYPADFSVSDLIHINFSQKFYLSQLLKQNHLPFITTQIANGLPLLAESQIGALNLFNLFLYKFFEPGIAFNLTYLFGFIIMNLSVFYLVKELTKNRELALFSSVTWMFAGIVMHKIVHQGILQAIFIMPLVFLLIYKILITRSLMWVGICAFVAAQQFLFGHFFVSLITNIFLIWFTLVYIYFNKQKAYQIAKLMFIYLLLFLLIIAPQLVQSLIYSIHSSRAFVSNIILQSGSFELPYLLTLLVPFPYGSLEKGTFFKNGLWPKTNTFPWESSIYLGCLIPILVLYIVYRYLISQRKFKIDFTILFYLSSFILSFFLMFGLNSPLRIIFSLPVINSFRAAARFSIFTSFFLLLALSLFLSKLNLKRYLLVSFMAIQLIVGWYYYHSYFPKVDYEVLKKVPLTSKYLSQDYFYEYGTVKNWRKTFVKKGYNAVGKYLNYQASNLPYLNLIYQTNSCGIFKSSNFNPNLYTQYIVWLDKELDENKLDNKLSLKSENLLRLLGCDYLLTPVNFKNKVKKVRINNYNLYKINNALPKYKLFQKTNSYYLKESFDYSLFNKNPRLHQELYTLDNYLNSPIDNKSKVTQILDSDHTLKFNIVTKENSILFIRQLNYPGWKAYIDNQSTQIHDAYALYMSVNVPKGEHSLTLEYHPLYWNITFLASIVGYISCLLILIIGIFGPNMSIPDSHDHKKQKV